ncbi:MAG: hypothetical protein ABL890_02315 [Candidatus Peribacteraceae bacterium]
MRQKPGHNFPPELEKSRSHINREGRMQFSLLHVLLLTAVVGGGIVSVMQWNRSKVLHNSRQLWEDAQDNVLDNFDIDDMLRNLPEKYSIRDIPATRKEIMFRLWNQLKIDANKGNLDPDWSLQFIQRLTKSLRKDGETDISFEEIGVTKEDIEKLFERSSQIKAQRDEVREE